MSDPWVDLDQPAGPEQLMTDEEAKLADQLYGAIQLASNTSERSQQSGDFTIGVSDIGTCHEYVRRMLAEIPEPVTDKLTAFLGTAIGDHVEKAVAHAIPDVITGASISAVIEGDAGRYGVVGHPDLIHPWGVGDVKTSFGLEFPRRKGPSDQQLFQRHIYTLGAHQAGLLGVPLERAKTYNVWFDRSGVEKQPHVHMDDYNPDVVRAAADWLDEAVYAYQQGQAARKDPPRTWCEKACGHFMDCRFSDTDVEGLLDDPAANDAARLYRDGAALVKQGESWKKQAAAQLQGVHGSTVDYQIRWTWISASSVAYDRKGYYRLNITPMK